MNGIQVFFDSNSNPKKKIFEPADLLTMVASACVWRQTMKVPVTLFCDRVTGEFLKKHELDRSWNEVDSISLDSLMDRSKIDLKNFPTAGKFFALSKVKGPVLLFDTDLIVWYDIKKKLKKNSVMFTHKEVWGFSSNWYPALEYLHTPNDKYKFDAEWLLSQANVAANTSMIWFKNDNDKRVYVENALNFLEGNFLENPRQTRPELLFVEQRLLPLSFMGKKGIKMAPFIESTWDSDHGKFDKNWNFHMPDNNEKITHTWIAKKRSGRMKNSKNFTVAD